MKKYRRRPAEVAAVQYTAETCRKVHAWLGIEHGEGREECGEALVLQTSGGELTVEPGDWIIQAKSLLLVSNDEAFRAGYEEVEA